MSLSPWLAAAAHSGEGRGHEDSDPLVAGALVFLLPLAIAYGVALLRFAMGEALLAAPSVVLGLALLAVLPLVAALVWAVSRARAWMLIFGAAVLVCGALLVRATFDLTWDGQAWHAFLVERIADGWNPLAARLEPPDLLFHMIANHYPKLLEVVATEIAAATGRFDDGRLVNFLLVPPAFFLALASLAHGRLRRGVPVVLASLVVLNPVVICQLLSLYVDGSVYLALVCLGGALLLLLRAQPRPSAGSWLLYALAAGVVVNLKAPALGYAVCLLLPALVVLVARRHVRRALAAAALFVAVVIGTGFHPYVQNLRDFGHPLYPIFGAARDAEGFALDALVAPQRPAGFGDASRVGRLALSLAARSDVTLEPAVLKIPWSVTHGELAPFAFPDVRKGGFGPLFALASLLALLAAALATRHRGILATWSIPAIVVLSTLVHAEGWWARYAPQLWLVPIAAARAALAADGRFARALAAVAVLTLSVDVALVAAPNLTYALRESRALRAQLARAAALDEACFAIRVDFAAPRLRLRERGIRHRVVGESECLDGELVGNYARLCRQCPAVAPR